MTTPDEWVRDRVAESGLPGRLQQESYARSLRRTMAYRWVVLANALPAPLSRQTRAQAVFWLWCLFGAVAVVLALSLVTFLPSTPRPINQPADPFVSRAGNRAPVQGPTTHPGPRLHVPVTALIVQQNPRCWSGVPGQVCP